MRVIECLARLWLACVYTLMGIGMLCTLAGIPLGVMWLVG